MLIMSFVTFNISGELFRISRFHLSSKPTTKLARELYWKEEEIDRDPVLFRLVILPYYRNNIINVPFQYSYRLVQAELDFYGIDYEKDELVFENVGYLWYMSTYFQVKDHITSIFRRFFKSGWFKQQSRHALEVVWVIGPLPSVEKETQKRAAESLTWEAPCPRALFSKEKNREVASNVLSSHFGVQAKWKVCEQKPMQQLHWPAEFKLYNSECIQCHLQPEHHEEQNDKKRKKI